MENNSGHVCTKAVCTSCKRKISYKWRPNPSDLHSEILEKIEAVIYVKADHVKASGLVKMWDEGLCW